MKNENINKVLKDLNFKIPETTEEEYVRKYNYMDILRVIRATERQINDLSLGNVIDIHNLSAGICDECTVPKMINTGNGVDEPSAPILFCEKINKPIEPELPEFRIKECKHIVVYNVQGYV